MMLDPSWVPTASRWDLCSKSILGNLTKHQIDQVTEHIDFVCHTSTHVLTSSSRITVAAWWTVCRKSVTVGSSDLTIASAIRGRLVWSTRGRCSVHTTSDIDFCPSMAGAYFSDHESEKFKRCITMGGGRSVQYIIE